MNSSVVELSGLSHRYAEHWALKDVTVRLDGTGVIGLLGSNGAGKSTLMNILCGCLSQTRGSAIVSGFDVRKRPAEARQRIGFLPQQAPLYLELRIEEYLHYCAALRRLTGVELKRAVDFVIDRCGLEPMRKRLINNLSGGYRQRVGIAQALVHRPPLIVLDEPTVGLDPNQLFGVRSLIQEIGEEHLVVFSTHILPEVETLCRNVLMIEQGEVVYSGNINGFRELVSSHAIRLVCDFPPSDSTLLETHSGILSVSHMSARERRIETNGDSEISGVLIDRGQSEEWHIQEVAFERASLEDVFKKLAGPVRHAQ